MAGPNHEDRTLWFMLRVIIKLRAEARHLVQSQFVKIYLLLN